MTLFEDDLSLQRVQLSTNEMTTMMGLVLSCALSMMLRWTVVLLLDYNQAVGSQASNASVRLQVAKLMAIEEGLVIVRF